MTRPTLVHDAGSVDDTAVREAQADSDRSPQMAKMPWYPRDFASSTRGWPLIARAAYRELLDAQWDLGTLPESPKELATIVVASPAEWRIAWPFVERKFPIGPDERRMNPRLEAHRRKALAQFRSQSSGGIAGNAKRWGRR